MKRCPTCSVRSGPCRNLDGSVCAPHSTWIAIAVPEIAYTSRERHAEAQRELRAARAAAGRCLNHANRLATCGVRCTDCAAVHGGYAAVKDRVASLQRELKRIGRAA